MVKGFPVETIKSTTNYNFLETLLKDGNYKTKAFTVTIPSGTNISGSGYMFTGSQGLRFDEYPSQIGFVVGWQIVCTKTCTIDSKLFSLQSTNVERIHRQHVYTDIIKENESKRHDHYNFVSPATSLVCYLTKMPTQDGSITTEDVIVTINYTWIELPLNVKQVNVEKIQLNIGDSITYGYGVTRTTAEPYLQWCAAVFKHFWDSGASLKFINRGIAGSTAENIKLLCSNTYLDCSEPLKVELITIMFGTNQTPTLAAYQDALTDIITRCLSEFPNAKIICLGPPQHQSPASTYEPTLATYRSWLESYVTASGNPRLFYTSMKEACDWDNPIYGLAGNAGEVHPNTEGNIAMATHLLSFLETHNISL